MARLLFSTIAIVAFVIVMMTTTISAEGGDYFPRNIHLALFGDTSQFMRVQWTTTSFAEEDYTPTVSYGGLAENLPWVVKGEPHCETTTYTEEEYHHNCILYNVQGSSRYFYRIGIKPGQTSVVTDFLMPPKYGRVQKSLLMGDLGLVNGENTAKLLEILNNDQSTTGSLPRISHIHHYGDIAYSDDAHRGQENPDFEPINNKFAEMIEPIARRVPYMVAVGNHDISASLASKDEILPTWGRNATHYNHRWKMPSATSHGVMSMWYAYTIGNTRFIVINTETDYPEAPFQPDKGDTKAGGFGDQVGWFERQLQLANRSEARLFAPWLVVIGHRPIISTLINDFPSDQQSKTRKWLEPLLQKYKVDLYVSGHSHLYERTYPMVDGKATQANYTFPQGPVYIVNGAAGNMEGHPVPGKDIMTDLPEFIPFREGLTYNVALLETFNSLPPVTTSSALFDENTGDYLNLDRLHNHTPNDNDRQAFFNEYAIELKKQSKKFTAPKPTPQPQCQRGRPVSMCYSAYPAFANPKTFLENQYLDRICIVKCI